MEVGFDEEEIVLAQERLIRDRAQNDQEATRTRLQALKAELRKRNWRCHEELQPDLAPPPVVIDSESIALILM